MRGTSHHRRLEDQTRPETGHLLQDLPEILVRDQQLIDLGAAAAGLARYWIVDPEGPAVVVHELADGVLIERARHGPGAVATLDVGPATVSFDPAGLLG